MLFSARWLSRYVRLPDSVDELGELLTRCGLVVEEQRPRGADTVFDLDVPTNRVDAMNHVGVAREIAAARRIDLRLPEPDAAGSGDPIAELTSVTIDDFAGCPRYCARLIRGVTVAPSPPWLVELLEAIGLRPLNNVADITNFVLWELGHPLHAFDFDRLEGHRIVVRRARAGETLTTLDDVRRTLQPEDVVIADADKPVALGGIMGGGDSAIGETSTNVLLEGAWFDPAAVRATAQRLALHTDASHRFERSPAFDGMLAALDRAAALVVELAGGELAAGTLDVVDEIPAPSTTTLRRARLQGLLGIEVAPPDVEDILGRLGFALSSRDDGYAVRIPSFRPDVSREEDLIEEVGRHVGYDRLPATLPVIRAVEEAGTLEVSGERRLKQCLSAAGCHEAMSSSLSSAKEQAWLLAPGEEPVALSNPISENLGVLRAHITPGLLAAVAHNVNHGQTSLRLFELGRCFTGPLSDDGVYERWGLGIVLTGERRGAHWDDDAKPVDFYDLKGIVEGVARQMAWPAWRWQAGERPGLAPGATALLESADGGAAVGWAGRLAPDAAAAFGIEIEVWLAELDIDALLPRPHPTPHYQPMSRFPGGVRDVALLLPADVTWQTLHTATTDAAADHDLPLADSSLVEVYRGEEIPAGSRGMTLRLLFRAADRTLTAAEIDAAVATVVERLARDCGARRR